MKTVLLIALCIAIFELLVTKIVEVLGCKASPYLIFAVVDLTVAFLIVGFALYDFKNAVGEFAGILGQLALMIGGPIVAVLLIADLILWKVAKSQDKEQE